MTAQPIPLDTEARRLLWRCRRGMLENDLILARFLDARGATLTEDRVAMLSSDGKCASRGLNNVSRIGRRDYCGSGISGAA